YTEDRMLAGYTAQYRELLEHVGRGFQPAAPQKRALDLTISAIGLLLLSPVLFAIAAAVRLTSHGPALFRQSRLGRGGHPFDLYKFRTMYVGAPDWRNPDGSSVTLDEDPRVTRAGRFLRNTSLDELPQLLNVFKGDMSLVGPRPDQADQIRFYD